MGSRAGLAMGTTVICCTRALTLISVSNRTGCVTRNSKSAHQLIPKHSGWYVDVEFGVERRGEVEDVARLEVSAAGCAGHWQQQVGEPQGLEHIEGVPSQHLH